MRAAARGSITQRPTTARTHHVRARVGTGRGGWRGKRLSKRAREPDEQHSYSRPTIGGEVARRGG